MFVIIGATGNVGRSTSSTLRRAGASVRAIVRDASKAEHLREIGCEVVVAELQDPRSLVDAIGHAATIQVVLPLSPQVRDPLADLHHSTNALTDALAQLRPARLLTISDYGAHVGEDVGMPSIFREFEARLSSLSGQNIVLRSAEHMHNWARVIPKAIATGFLPTFQDPIDKPQPTIAASDLGIISANLLLGPDKGAELEVIHAEGPRRYSAIDVASALSHLSGRAIQARAIPRTQWDEILAKSMPPSLAELMIKTNDAKNKGGSWISSLAPARYTTAQRN